MSTQAATPSEVPLSLSEHLQAVTEALAAARTPQEVFGIVLTPALQALNAIAGAILLVNETGERLELAATQGYEEGAQTLWQDGPLDDHVPAGDALEQHEPLFFEQQGALVQAYPELEARTGAVAAVATAVLPMFLDDQPLGAIILDFKQPHHFTPEERRFLQTLAAQCAIALGRARLTADLQRQVQERTARALDEARAQEAFVAFTEAVGTETDLLALAQQAIAVLRVRFHDGSIGYYTPDGDLWKARAWSEDMDEVLIARLRAGLPSSTHFIRDALQTGLPVFTDAWDPEREEMEHTEAYGSAAAYPLVVDGEVRHLLLCGLRGIQRWTERDRALVRAVGRSLTLAFDRAEQTRQVEEERAALDAFAAFAEASAGTTDVQALAQRAVEVLRAVLGEVSVAYSELHETRWKARVWSDDHTPEVMAVITAGIPITAPSYAEALATGDSVFVSGWEAAREGVAATEGYGAGAFYPCVVDGDAHGLLVMGTQQADDWSPRERQVFRAVGRSLTLALERTAQARKLATQNAELEARTLALGRFAQLARSPETDAPTLIRQVQETVHELIGEGFAVYYELDDHTWHLRSQTGSPEDATIQASLESALPYETVLNFRIPWERGVPFYQDVYDPTLDHGVPGTKALASTATLPVWVDTRRQGLFGYGLKVSRPWTRADRATLETAVNSLALLLERAERSRVLEAERASLDAFVRFTEQSTHTTDTLSLAREAKDVLVATLSVDVGYSELEDGLWRCRLFSENTPPEVVAQAKQGFPASLPGFPELFEEDSVVFVDGWDPQGVEHTELYGAVALYSYCQGRRSPSLLTMGTSKTRVWTERERRVFRSVGRSLALAFERAEQTAQQERQTAELDARTRAIEGFADLTRDLSVEVDPYVLIERAQTMVLSLLPEGYAVYFEPEGDRWILRGQTGDLGNAALQAAVNAGLPYHEANNLVIPFESLKPYYQDHYAPDTDHLEGVVAHVGATATLPVLVNGRARGVFAIGLFGGVRSWTRPDQGALEAVVRSLGLALERAAGVAELEARSQEISAWRERYEVAVQGSGDLLYDWDPATDVIVYGGAVEQITGYGVQELQGNLADWTEHLIHPDDRAPFAQEIARAVASGGEAHVAFRLLHKDGSIREVEDDGYFKRDAQGEVTQMVGFVKDVTERRQAERALRQLNEELRRSNAELEQFAYIASHDLQAPIRAVTSFAGIIGKRYGDKLDERGQLYLQQIMDGGEHMKRLVDDLLTFSRIHTQQRPLLPTDAETVFDAVASRLQAETPGAIITRETLPVVLADAQQLDQLLQNLIGNGLKYRRADVAPRVHVSAEREGECWRFAVSDNGIGIEPQYFERIFVIFQRLHGRESFEGTGIGLAVCKKIVERHGGRLWLESTLGQGSTFFFTLPEA